MSQHAPLDLHLTRRSWMVLTASAVAGCGGGSGSLASLPGTGGTGIYAQGSISGFGSVIINSIRFDDASATVQIDGHSVSRSDLRLGMVASVQAQRGADAVSGTATASSIEVWSVAQGLVTQVLSGAVGGFIVSGMTVQVDSSTVLEGISSASAFTPGLRVAVWGLQAGAEGARWAATRVALTTDAALVSTGLVQISDAQRFVNGLRLQGPLSENLAAGALARVQGALASADAAVGVTQVKLLGSPVVSGYEGSWEIEGLVTAVQSANRFVVGTNEVDASRATYVPAGAQIAVGTRVEVQCAWQAGLLVASRVEVGEEKALLSVQISGSIEQFTSLANFVVRGQRCDATGVTLVGNGSLTDLKLGTSVKLTGTKAGNVVKVLTLTLL